MDRQALERGERGEPGRGRRSGWLFLGLVALSHGALALLDGALAARAEASFVRMLGEVLRLLAHYSGFGYMLVLSALLGAFAVVNGWLVEWLTPPGNAE